MSVNLLLFGIYPYVALAICLIGSWARFDLAQYSWKAVSYTTPTGSLQTIAASANRGSYKISL